MDLEITRVYILSVEEPGDFIFTPGGAIVLFANGQFKVFCVPSSHNLFRAALNRHSWEQLEKGIEYKGAEFRVDDVTTDMTNKGWTHASSIPLILRNLYESNPRHLFFLERFVSDPTTL